MESAGEDGRGVSYVQMVVSNRTSNLREERCKSSDDGDTHVGKSGLCRDLERGGRGAAIEALNDIFDGVMCGVSCIV